MIKRKLKRGAVGVNKIITIIALVVLLILLIFWGISGGLTQFIRNVGGIMDTFMVGLGFKQGGGQQYEDCMSEPIDFELDGGGREAVVFERCFREEGERCSLKTFGDGSNYYYTLESGKLEVSREDTGHLYELNVESVLSEPVEGEVSANEIYYNSVVYLYSVFGIDGDIEGRVMSYSIFNYMKAGMDKDLGQFHDMLVIHGYQTRVYFMEANGRFLIFDLDTLEEGSGAGINPEVITPIRGAFKDPPTWALYYGTDRDEALQVLQSEFDGYFDERMIYYSICNPQSSNVVYHNCFFDEKREEVNVLLNKIYSDYSSKDSSLVNPGTGDKQLDEEAEYDLLDYYLNRRVGNSKNGIIKEGAVGRLNERFRENEGSFEIRGEKFLITSVPSQTKKVPLVKIVSEDNSKRYYLRFNGNDLYREGELEFFHGQGNQLRSPFMMVDVASGKEVDVSRTFAQSDSENLLDKRVLEFFKGEC